MSFSRKQLLYPVLSAVCLILIATFAVNAQVGTKLNQGLLTGQTITDYQVSPDGKYAVYKLQREVDFNIVATQLWSVEIATSVRKSLTPSLVNGKTISSYQISPNGLRVIYVSDRGTAGKYELYSVPITGSATITKLNGTLATSCEDCDVFDNFKISPDSKFVVYQADQESESVDLLYTVPIAGGTTAKKLSQGLSAGEAYGDFQFTPNSSRILFLYGTTFETQKLYSVPIAGGTPVSLTTVVSEFDFIFKITGDSSRVVYRDDRDGNGKKALYSNLITNTTRTQLSVSGEDVGENFQLFRLTDKNVADFQLSSTVQRNAVVYTISREDGTTAFSGATVTNSAHYAVPVDAGGRVESFSISPDSEYLVFIASVQGTNKLFSVGYSTGGAILTLNNDFPEFSPGVSDFQITSDSKRVVYSGWQDLPYNRELYSVSINSGSFVKLNVPARGPDGNGNDSYDGLVEYHLTANGTGVAFTFTIGDAENGTTNNLYYNSVSGSPSPQVIATNTDASAFYATPLPYNKAVFTRTTFPNDAVKTELYKANLPN